MTNTIEIIIIIDNYLSCVIEDCNLYKLNPNIIYDLLQQSNNP